MLNSRSFSAADKWGVWKNHFAQQYDSTEHEALAFDAFAQNNQIIKEHNAKNSTFKLGHNEFSAMTWDQFKAAYVSGMDSNPQLRRTKNYAKLPAATADSIDWVTNGAVTPIKNQGQCGSCWAFSTTGAFEGAYQITTGTLLSFSEQQLVSCDKVDDGCSGGLMDNAFKWIKSNGLCTEDAYPYTSSSGTTGSCVASCTSSGSLSGFTDVTGGDESALQAAVQTTPVSVAIEADKSVFQLYSSGVFTSAEECGTQLDHGVLAVGYGSDGGQTYWKVKNSWGSSWGESGYIRMERGANCCGIATQPSYPTGVTSGAGPIPGPTPTPGPSPTPSPTPSPGPDPSCADAEDSSYCDYTKSQGYCSLLSDSCKLTCGCCDANPPSYCS